MRSSLNVSLWSFKPLLTIAGIAVEDVVTAKLVYDKYMATQKASWPVVSWSETNQYSVNCYCSDVC